MILIKTYPIDLKFWAKFYNFWSNQESNSKVGQIVTVCKSSISNFKLTMNLKFCTQLLQFENFRPNQESNSKMNQISVFRFILNLNFVLN